MRPEGQIWNITSWAIPKKSWDRQEVSKGMKCARKKGVKEEKIFKEGSAIIRCEFWKDDPGSIWIVNLKRKRFVDKKPS